MPVRDVNGRGNVRRRDEHAGGGRVHGAGNAGNAREVRAGGGAAAAGGADGVDATPGNAQPLRNQNITGPFAALAKRGDFSGYVTTRSAQELFVSVRVAKQNAGNERPLVYLDGLAARRNRSDMMADKFRDDGGRTVISILLPGQGETLLRDLQKNRGRSLRDDIKDSSQANAIIEALDALGVDKPVDIFGLSYGGAIAAAAERDHPERFENVLLCAPHTRSQARDEMGELVWNMTVNNPWNPMGNAMYRSAAKSTLSKAFGERELFKDHPGAFAEALFRLSMGIDKNELQRTTRGLENVHVLVAEGDGASPPKYNKLAVDAARSGSLTMAPEAFKGQHDLVTASPELVVLWVTSKLNPERADDVNKVLLASMKKRIPLDTAQQLIGLAAQGVVEGAKKPPAEAVAMAGEAAKAALAAAKTAHDAVVDAEVKGGKPAAELAETAAKIARGAAELAAAAAKAAPSTEASAVVKAAQAAAQEAAKLATAARAQAGD